MSEENQKNENKNKKMRKLLAKIVEYFIIISMIILTLSAAIFFAQELYDFINNVLHKSLSNKAFIDDVFYLLIYVEVIFIGLKYFQENLHIPKRYFLYIGITTLVKEIFIHPEYALKYCGAILLLVIASVLIKYVNFVTKDKQNKPITESSKS